jgi:hypothetical protein
MRTSSRRFLAADLKGLVEVNKALPEGETQQEEDYYHEPRGTASQHEAGKSYILGQFWKDIDDGGSDGDPPSDDEGYESPEEIYDSEEAEG